MLKTIFAAALGLCPFSIAAAQTPGYHCIYGNKYGTTVDVNINSIVDIKLWAATPATTDSVIVIHNPLASDNDYIAYRYHGGVFPPLDTWNVIFSPLDTVSQPGYMNRSLLGSCSPIPLPCIPLNTGRDTVAIAYFTVRIADDSSLIGQTVCPFIEGYHPANGGILWGIQDGITPIIPSQTFSCLYFVEYLAGDANSSGNIDGLDVTYLVTYFKGFGPPPDPFLGGDANGDCIVNGMDVVYLVAYLKGGPEPFLGSCH